MKLKRTIALILVVMMLLTFGACGKKEGPSKLETIKAAKRLIVGLNSDYPPFEFIDVSSGTEKIVGLDIDIAQEICKDLGVELEIVNMDFNGLLAAMQLGKLDVVISGMNADEDRKKTVDFSDEYYKGDQAMLVRAADASTFATVESFKGKKVGAQLGSIPAEVADDQVKPSGAEIVNNANVQTLVLDLQTSKIDGLVLDKPIADAFVAQYTDDNGQSTLAISACPLKGDESGFGVAVPKGNEDLVKEINKTLKRLKDSGQIDKYLMEANELSAKQAKPEAEAE